MGNDQIDALPSNVFNGQRIESEDSVNNLNETSINQIDEFNSIEIPVLEKAMNCERYSSFASKTSIDFNPESLHFNRRLVLDKNFLLEDLYYRMPSTQNVIYLTINYKEKTLMPTLKAAKCDYLFQQILIKNHIELSNELKIIQIKNDHSFSFYLFGIWISVKISKHVESLINFSNVVFKKELLEIVSLINLNLLFV